MLRKVLFLVFMLILPHSATAADQQAAKQAIKSQLERFIAQEYKGEAYTRNDESLVAYGPDLPSAMTENVVSSGTFLDINPLFVVDGYTITNISISKRKATVTVEFHRLAKTVDVGLMERQLVPGCSKRDTTTYNLIYNGKRWLLYDPPWPRVSHKAMLQFYNGKIQAFEGYIHKPETSEYQKAIYKKTSDDFAILNALSEASCVDKQATKTAQKKEKRRSVKTGNSSIGKSGTKDSGTGTSVPLEVIELDSNLGALQPVTAKHR